MILECLNQIQWSTKTAEQMLLLIYLQELIHHMNLYNRLFLVSMVAGRQNKTGLYALMI